MQSPKTASASSPGRKLTKVLQLSERTGTTTSDRTDNLEEDVEQVHDMSDLDLGLDSVKFTIKNESSQASRAHHRKASLLDQASDSVQEGLVATAAAAAAAVDVVNQHATKISERFFAEQAHAGESEEKRKQREEKAKDFLWWVYHRVEGCHNGHHLSHTIFRT